MLFTTPTFGVFFLVVLVLHWRVITGDVGRKSLLLVASYVFYGAWDVRFLGLIMLSTIVDYVAAQRIEGAAHQATKQRWLILSLSVNLGILGIFKYLGFFADSLRSLLDGFGVEVSEVTLNITLPVGISFFTFQTMSYTIDVYRRKLHARKELLDVALFVAFFPQLVAGPIVRASHFLPQLHTSRRLDSVKWRVAIGLFFVGFFKKAVIADTIGAEIDSVWATPESYDVVSTLLAVFGYAAQIYCDFSGYTDMAIAAAMMLGYSLGENFYFPYFSHNITEFWRRWHISLSSWLRDYLYISLGGNRRGVRITYRNLMITMLLGGLWHGAAWTFVVWGGLHGAGLAIHKWWTERFAPARPSASDDVLVRLVKMAATFLFVCFGWIFFRAASFGDAGRVIANIATLSEGAGAAVSGWIAVYLLMALTLHAIAYQGDLQIRIEEVPAERFAFALGVGAAFVLALRPLGSAPFIYFQF